MSDFFQPPPPREPDDVPPQPPWLGPPENELGVPVPLRRLLARTDDVAVALLDVSAYSTGLQFRMEVRLRRHDDAVDPFALRMQHAWRSGSGEIPDEVLRLGFELADGSRVTNLGHFPRFEGEQKGPVLIQRGGGGGGRSWSFGYWLWPLPPPSPLALVIEWPSQGIPLRREELDAAPLLAAAAESEQLWPEGGPGPGSGAAFLTRLG